MKLTFLPIRAFAPILFLAAFLGLASPAFAGHCMFFDHGRVDEKQMTDLHCAALANNATRAEELIHAGADVDARDNIQWTPLHLAAEFNADKVAALLIQAGADVNARDKDGKTALDHASDKVANLIRNSQESADEPPQAAPQAANPAQAQIVVDGSCDLCDAVKLGDAEIIALLLQAGHDPNARDASGKTVLSYAIQSQRVDLVRMLTQGVDAPPPEPEAPPPPDPAVLRAAEEDSALERARSADSLEGWLAFAEGEFGDGKYAAIAKSELREITEESFLRHRTALHFAADDNDIPQAEMLLRAGANPNAQTDRGFTPLMFAAQKSNVEIVKMLLDYGANPKLRERNRKNALDYVRGENGYAIREMIKKWRPSQ